MTNPNHDMESELRRLLWDEGISARERQAVTRVFAECMVRRCGWRLEQVVSRYAVVVFHGKGGEAQREFRHELSGEEGTTASQVMAWLAEVHAYEDRSVADEGLTEGL